MKMLLPKRAIKNNVFNNSFSPALPGQKPGGAVPCPDTDFFVDPVDKPVPMRRHALADPDGRESLGVHQRVALAREMLSTAAT